MAGQDKRVGRRARYFATGLIATAVLGSALMSLGITAQAGPKFVITNKPPICATGFKAIKQRGRSYLCVSRKPVCSKNYQVFPGGYNKKARRFEYVCALPEG